MTPVTGLAGGLHHGPDHDSIIEQFVVIEERKFVDELFADAVTLGHAGFWKLARPGDGRHHRRVEPRAKAGALHFVEADFGLELGWCFSVERG